MDLQALWKEDADQARQLSDALNQRMAALSQVNAEIQRQERRAAEERQAAVQQQLAADRETLDRKIKNFSSEKAPALVEYAVSLGMDRQEAELWPLNPMLAEMGYKSIFYDKMQAKAKTLGTATAPVKPSRGVKGSGQVAAVKPEEMNDAAFRAYLGLGEI